MKNKGRPMKFWKRRKCLQQGSKLTQIDLTKSAKKRSARPKKMLKRPNLKRQLTLTRLLSLLTRKTLLHPNSAKTPVSQSASLSKTL